MKKITTLLVSVILFFTYQVSRAGLLDCSNPIGLSGGAAGSYDAGNYRESLRLNYLLLNCKPDTAHTNLGRHFENGNGVDVNYRSAVSHYEKAARHGHPYAALLLARMYANGKGVLQNYVIAHVLSNLAAVDGYGSDVASDGSALVAELSAKMTANQLEVAQRLAKACKEKNKDRYEYADCGF
jgi:TPR repeat protein